MATKTITDFEQFVEILRDVKADFEANPHTYPNEQAVVAETYTRLRTELPHPTLPTTMSRTEVSDKVGALDATSPAVPRVRPAVSFYDSSDQGWRDDDGMVWPEQNRPHPFDLAVFAEQRFIQMRTRRTGPGNWWDLRSNQISILAEVKHSKASTQKDEFSGPKKGVEDIRRLANTGGGVQNRAVVFFDLLYDVSDQDPDRPDEEFAALRRELELNLDETPENRRLSGLPNLVHVFYVPRVGSMRHIQVSDDRFDVESL